MKWSEETDKISTLLLDVQINVGPVSKNAENPYFNSNYADLNAVWGVLQPLLADKGLLVTQGGAVNNGKPTLITRVTDAESGQWVECEAPLDGGKTDPQGIGSAITYQRRYSLCALFGLMMTDDDGNAAQPRQQQQQRKAGTVERRNVNQPQQSQQAGGDFDVSREIILGFKPLRKKLLGDMDYGDTADAIECGEWRIENPGRNPKYHAKNRAEAQEDVRQLRAYQETLGRNVGPDNFDYATRLPEKEPPF